MIMTMHDRMTYHNSTPCHICNEELGKDRVRDHCHLTGMFRAVAHEICNLKYKVPNFVPVIFHNLSGSIVTYLLKHWKIAKEIFLLYQIMKKTTFLSQNRSSLTN